jgi:exopolysaccharide biosynthesis protein
MRAIFKKTVTIALLTMVIAAQTLTSSAYTKIYEKASPVEAYADGVTHQNIKIYTNEGWINMNVLRVDLRKNVEMTVLTDTVLSTRDTITNLVKKNNANNTIVAAINSDFFDTANSTTMGNLVKDGKILTTAVGYDEFASFNMSTEGLPYVGYINSPNNKITNGTYTKTLSYINKPYLAYSRTIMYDNDFANKSYGKNIGSDVLEMLVLDGVIVEIRRKGEPFTIPDNGFVIASVGNDIGEMLKNFKMGDPITVVYDVNFKYMDLSIGGGAQLIKDGTIITNFSQNIKGNQPRTGLGITKDRKELILVTIDGRTSSYRGVTQTELASLLKGLGAHEAINLDGGGSTQMVSKSPWTNTVSTVNHPSDQAERKMYTALAIEKLLEESPVLRTTKISMNNTRMLLGSEVAVTLLGSDTNYNPVAIPAKDVVWSVTGVTGTFAGGKFVPSSLGKGTITAAYGGIVANQEIVVKNNGVQLIVSPSSLKVDENQEKTVTFSILTEEGETIPISSKVVKAVVPPTLGTFNYDKSTFVAGGQVGQGYITCEFDGLKAYIPVGVGVDKQLFYDFEKPTATFSSYPVAVTGSYQETATNAKAGLSGLLSYDFSKTTETRAAYMTFTSPVTLPKDTQGIGMWVFGDEGNDHWLRAKVVDAKGIATNITFTTHVDWTGWKYVTADLPTGATAPFILERIYLAETDATRLDTGYIMIDNIDAITSQALTVTLPGEVNRLKKVADYKLPADLVGKTNKLMNMIYYTEKTSIVESLMKAKAIDWTTNTGTYAVSDRSDATVFKMVNKKGSIRANDYTQWTKFLNFVNTTTSTKPVVLMMSDVYTFNDSLENDLFLTQLQTLSDKGIDVAVIFPTSNATFSVAKTNGATIVKVPRTAKSLSYLMLGISNNKIYFEAK